MNGKLPYEYQMMILSEQDQTFKKRTAFDLLAEFGINDLFETLELTIDLIKEFPRR